MGIKSQSVNLYHNFYTSDLLIASPLGLRRILGGEGDKERDVDFLSSIEMVILDQVGDGTWLSLPLPKEVFHFNGLCGAGGRVPDAKL